MVGRLGGTQQFTYGAQEADAMGLNWLSSIRFSSSWHGVIRILGGFSLSGYPLW